MIDMYARMCAKYGKARVWGWKADELLDHVDELLKEERK